MKGKDICSKALKVINSKKYVYWYGGKGEKCTNALLKRLSTLYPSVYTASYIKNCKIDISNRKYCIDCSGFVSMVYGWQPLGTYGIYSREGVSVWTDKPRNGMILWRSGHCGIYYNGRVLEARSQSLDLTSNRAYLAKDWVCVLYSVDVNYSEEVKRDLNALAKDIIAGKYGNGAARIKKLTAEGYSSTEIKQVQEIVNLLLKSKK